jgi:hypothetical protein
MSRASNLATLRTMGFVVAPDLRPARDAIATVRPAIEIARRLCGLDAVCSWVMSSEQDNPSDLIEAYVDDNDLDVTGDDVAILQTPRKKAREAWQDAVGWRLENMWPLAWTLGFAPVPLVQGMVGDDVIAPLFAFLPQMTDDVAAWAKQQKPRRKADVVDLEDLFFCAHHAARSAQQGAATVPAGFHPGGDGGVVHERRHALTWALSPDTAWDDTDLST